MWKTFKSKMEEAEKLIPKKLITINDIRRKCDKSLDRKILAKIKHKNRLWERCTRSNDGKAYLENCKIKNQERESPGKLKRQLKELLVKKVKKNPTKFWQFANKMTKNKVSIPDLVIDDDATVPHIVDNIKPTKQKHLMETKRKPMY